MPSWHRYPGFLAGEERDGLLRWTLEHRDDFVASRLIGGIVDPQRRVSQRLRDMGPFREVFERRIASVLDDLFRRTGTRPFAPDHVELEIVAHGDGAHFAPHIDIPVGPGRTMGGERTGSHDRLLSGVYYFHAEPKAFSGGELRLHRFGDSPGHAPGDWVDLAPEQNSLVVFPTWALHEVRTVHCPGGAFAESRFAVNAWLRGTLP
jgi:SM-20-related protein